MRLLLALAAYAALTVSGFAQGIKEVEVSSVIRIPFGGIKIITFDQPITKIDTPDSIIQISPETDRTFSLRAVRPGTTLLSAYDEGKIVYRGFVTVLGGSVRIYGTDPDVEYIDKLCTEYGCTSASVGEQPAASSSVSVRRQNRKGDIITTTKNY